MIAVVFTRHKLTEEQAQAMDLSSVDVLVDASHLAAEMLNSISDGYEMLREVMYLAAGADCAQTTITLFGVIPTALRAALHESDNLSNSRGLLHVRTMEALNVDRAPQGEKPQFTFSGWLLTGYYRFDRP